MFRREVAEKVDPLLLVKQFAFDLEFLAVARARLPAHPRAARAPRVPLHRLGRGFGAVAGRCGTRRRSSTGFASSGRISAGVEALPERMTERSPSSCPSTTRRRTSRRRSRRSSSARGAKRLRCGPRPRGRRLDGRERRGRPRRARRVGFAHGRHPGEPRSIRGPARGRRGRARRVGAAARRPRAAAAREPRVRRGAPAAGETVWNGHVHVDTDGQPVRRLLERPRRARLAGLLRRPADDELRPEDFDRYPKGTTCFLAPRALLLEASTRSAATTPTCGVANDDTPLIRWIAERERIHLSPVVRVRLRAAREPGVVRSSRGPPGHGVRRWARATGVALLPGRGCLLPGQRRARGRVAAPAVLVPARSRDGAWRPPPSSRQRRAVGRDSAPFGALAPVYAVAHGAGMWRGLACCAGAAARRIR